MKSLIRLLRIPEWLDSNVTFHIFTIAYLLFVGTEHFDMKYFYMVQTYILFLCTFLAANYYANDLADIEADRAAGKVKEIGKYKTWQLALIMVVVVAIGIIPLFWWTNPTRTILWAGAVYFCGLEYSLKPLRLKEKGVWGAIGCSAAQRCAPLILLLTWDCIKPEAFIIMLIFNFFMGIRYIFIHQIIDLENDLKTGIKTFGTEHPVLIKRLLYGNIVIEIIMMAVSGVYLLERASVMAGGVFALVLVIYLIILMVFIRAVRYMLNENIFETYSFVPFEDYYSIFLPLLMTGFLCTKGALWVVDIVFIVLVEWKMFRVRLGFITKYFEVKRENSKRR